MNRDFPLDRARLLAALRGQRVGVVCTPAAWWPGTGGLADWLNVEVDVHALIALEHGLRGELQDGIEVESQTDSRTGLPVYSLYNEKKALPAACLDTIDTICFCAQDVSHRAYTFKESLAILLASATAHGKRLVVVDRPTPLGHLGPMGPVARQFFPLPLPVVIPYTLGELALYLNASPGYGAALTVVPCVGWHRSMQWCDDATPWVPPSPNIPTLTSVYAYAATGLLQATNLSEGRGTCKPFEYVGAPYVDAAALAGELSARGPGLGILSRDIYFRPMFNIHAGEVCGGIHLMVQDRNRFAPLAVGLTLLQQVARLHPTEFRLTPTFGTWLDGSAWSPGRLRDLDIDACLAEWATAAAGFAARMTDHLLYSSAPTYPQKAD